MARVKLTTSNSLHKPVKDSQKIEDLIELAARGDLPAYLAAGGDLYITANQGISVLHALARKNSGTEEDRKALKAFLDAGMAPDVVNVRGETPLMRSVRSGAQWLWQPLVEAGADINRADNQGRLMKDLVVERCKTAWPALEAYATAFALQENTHLAQRSNRKLRL